MPKPVTDPDLLSQLEAKPVTDPALLEQLETPQPRGVMDKLLGTTGPRYQLWPERMARDILSAPKEAVTAAENIRNRDVTGNDVTKDAGALMWGGLLASPMVPRAAKITGAPTQQQLFQSAEKGYETARNLPLDVKPTALTSLGETIGATLNRDGINEKLAPKTFSIISELAKPPAGSVATVSNFETLRRSLGHAAQDFSNPTEQKAATAAIRHLDDYLGNIPQSDVLAGAAAPVASTLKDARGNYAAGKRSEALVEALTSADRQAAAANSGQNIGNAQRQRVRSILENDKRHAGYTADELAQADRVVGGTITGNTARTLGNMLGGGGGIGTPIAAGVGATLLPPWGAALPLAGYGLRKLSNASTDRQTKILLDMLQSRSPLGKSMAPGPITSQDLIRAIMRTRPAAAGQNN